MLNKNKELLYKIGLNKNNTPILLTTNSNVDYQEYLLSFLKGLFEKTNILYETYLQSVNSIILDANNIKKGDIETIFKHINVSPLQKNQYKICVIENIECFSPLLSNALLKTIEEPLQFSYLIFTTNNIANVLDTIKSRCNIINICSNLNIEIDHENLKLLNNEQKNSLISSFKNVNSLKNWLNDESSLDVINMFLELINHKNDELELLKLNNIFIKLDYKQIKILINWILNYFYLKDNTYFQLIIDNYDINLSKHYIFHCLVEYLMS